MAQLDSLIVETPGTVGGKARIAETRIPVSDVVIWHLRLGMTVDEIADAYSLSLASVHAALAFYYENQDSVDRSITESEAFAETLRREHPSPLREKLKTLAGG